MAINRYRLTATVTVAAGTAATVVAGEPGTAGPAGYGSKATTGGPVWGTTYLEGQDIMLDPTGALYTAIGSGNLVQLTGGPEDGTSGGHIGTSN